VIGFVPAAVPSVDQIAGRPKGQVSKAGATGLEPATSGVTGRRSNQLSYAPERFGMASVAMGGERLPPPRPGVRRGGGCALSTTPP
jgi:hypothetical protein